MKISIKRAYTKPTPNDGYRILVDRVWPRGLKKEDLKLDEWNKDVAPSNELRQWFNHEPEKFTEFNRKYRDELKKSNAASTLLAIAKKQPVALVYSAKNEQYNQAVVLKEFLEKSR